MIREFLPESNDAEMDLLLSAYLAIWNHPENLPFLSFTGKLFETSEVRGWFSNRITKGVRYFASVGDKGQIAGIVLTSNLENHGFNIGGIGVLPEQKGKGIGKALVRKVFSEAELLGYNEVETEVFPNNTRMLRLLLGLGFVPFKMEYGRGATGEDFLLLRKQVA